MSLEEASWDTWIPSHNSENNSISYSTKGEIAGLLLDLEIRVRTRSEKSLDDLMRYLLENFANQGLGVPDDGVLDALNAITATEFAEFYQTVIQSRTELDYNRHLAPAGLRVQVNRQLPVLFMGVQVTEADGNRVRSRVMTLLSG